MDAYIAIDTLPLTACFVNRPPASHSHAGASTCGKIPVRNACRSDGPCRGLALAGPVGLWESRRLFQVRWKSAPPADFHGSPALRNSSTASDTSAFLEPGRRPSPPSGDAAARTGPPSACRRPRPGSGPCAPAPPRRPRASATTSAAQESNDVTVPYPGSTKTNTAWSGPSPIGSLTGQWRLAPRQKHVSPPRQRRRRHPVLPARRLQFGTIWFLSPVRSGKFSVAGQASQLRLLTLNQPDWSH